MIIKSIHLENFLQFKNKTDLQFSSDPEKNVTIIQAENGYGKTNLVKAALWCLYGNCDVEVLNDEVRVGLMNNAEGATDCAIVEMSIENDGKNYRLYRNRRYIRKAKSLSKEDHFRLYEKLEDGNETQINGDTKNEIINHILPEELSEYFFYEEKRFAEISKQKNIKDAVEDFSGIKKLKNVADVFSKASEHINARYKTKDDKNLQNYEIALNNLKVKHGNELNDLNNARNQLDYYSSEYTKYDRQIASYAVQIEQRDKLERYKRQADAFRDSIPGLLDNVFKAFNKNYFNLFAALPVFQETINVINTGDKGESVETLPGVDIHTINRILETGTCICGAKITKDSPGYKHLIDMMQKVPPNEIGGTVAEYKATLKEKGKNASYYIDSVKRAYNEYSSKVDALEQLEDQIAELANKLSGSDAVIQLRMKRARASSEKQRLEVRVKSLEKSTTEDNLRIEELQDKIDKIAQKSVENQKFYRAKCYADDLYRTLQVKLDHERHKVLDMINQYVNSNFRKLYHGTRDIVIDENYNITAENDYEGEKLQTGLSGGSTDIESFAFVFGLEEIAVHKIELDDDQDDNSNKERYPLFLDAPFSHVDNQHIQNLCNLLPQVSNQVIIAVSEKDWNLTSNYLKCHTGAVYRMQKINEQETEIHKIEKWEEQ